MTEPEIRQNLINTYVMLLQIKAAEKAENKMLDIQLEIVKIQLLPYDVDIKALEKMILG